MRAVCYCTALLLLSGCDLGGGSAPESASLPDDTRIANPSELPPHFQQMRREAFGRMWAQSEVFRLFAGVNDWREAHARATRALAAAPSISPGMLPPGLSLEDARRQARAALEQKTAEVMLEQYLLQTAPTPEALEASITYVELLLRRQARSMWLAAAAVDRLEGHLFEPERQRLAADALALTRMHLARFEPRPDAASHPAFTEWLEAAARRLAPAAGF